jgi:hypothetical protein
MNNAESVRQFQPRVALWQPWEKRIPFLEGATLKELRRRLLTANRATPFRVANNLPSIFEPRVSKQTLGWNWPTLSALICRLLFAVCAARVWV